MERKQAAIRHVLESGDYQDDAPGWLHENWSLYLEFERLALQAMGHGRTRLSAKFLFELIRWNTQLHESEPTYKVNNTYASDCARLFAHLNPGAAGLFEFRERRAVA